MSDNMKRKLSSRKFWALVAGLVTSLLVLFELGQTEIERVVALVGAVGSIMAYIFGESIVDSKRESGDVYVIEEAKE